ncbi:MAG: HAD-IIIA family hydrolase [Desulfovibrio sp.]|jgi:D-glycero-D-manno-heptose 1,7-bisphosphate phosphatase|nr:HAD-IIIA family hydrolase [Desulfovibrio sp.]
MPRLTALLLDRDGTIIPDKGYLADPAGVELLPGAGEALAALARRGCRLFLASNQSGVGRGYFPREAVLACNAALAALLAPYGVFLADSVFCPHAPEDRCSCRKPATGLWEILRLRHGLRPADTAMLGDKPADMAFAARAGLAARLLLAPSVSREGDPSPLRRLRPAGEEHPDLILPGLALLPAALSLLEGGCPCGPSGDSRR